MKEGRKKERKEQKKKKKKCGEKNEGMENVKNKIKIKNNKERSSVSRERETDGKGGGRFGWTSRRSQKRREGNDNGGVGALQLR